MPVGEYPVHGQRQRYRPKARSDHTYVSTEEGSKPEKEVTTDDLGNKIHGKEGAFLEESISKILELGISQGIWAALYIYLFFRMLKENKEREDRYQETIDRLSGNIEGGIEKIQNKLDSMSNGD